MKTAKITLICLLWTTLSLGQQEVLGKWLTEGKDAQVEIYQKDHAFFGKIIQLIPETQADGSPIIDENNPDKTLRQRPVLGIDIIVDFKWDKDNKELTKGKVYDPNNGKFYKGKIWSEDGQLKMRGYIGFLYRTETWTRIE